MLSSSGAVQLVGELCATRKLQTATMMALRAMTARSIFGNFDI